MLDSDKNIKWEKMWKEILLSDISSSHDGKYESFWGTAPCSFTAVDGSFKGA
jgi:hypothetical protein